MYYPLLRARQFELIALRELAIEGATQNTIRPILEPVKGNHNNLNLAHRILADCQQEVYLILNPGEGENKGDGEIYLNYLKSLDSRVYKPTFYYRNNANYITNSIDEFGLEDCMLLCQNDLDVEDADFRRLVERDEIEVVNMEDPDRNREAKRFIQGTGKGFIRRDDLFEREARNSDYLDIAERKFSEEHLYYAGENYSGFSDYTVLQSEFSEGGSTPRAVVIHLTYLKNNSSIWIRHFTSETNDSIANIQGKFAEAAEKTLDFCRQEGLQNSAIQELREYYDTKHYPGLGTVKKISIKNHLLLLSKYLKDQ